MLVGGERGAYLREELDPIDGGVIAARSGGWFVSVNNVENLLGFGEVTGI